MSFPLSKLIDSLKAFFANPIILSCLTSWLFAQVIKATIAIIQMTKRSSRDIIETLLWRTGGMPSSHTAVVTSMTAAVAFSEGLGSNLFAVSLFVTLVVMRDAVGVRRAVGVQAQVLNLLGRHSAENLGNEYNPVKEIRGHAPLEVIVGALLGIIVSAVFALL